MSNRTLIEINHDNTHEIETRPEEFVAALTAYLRSGDVTRLPDGVVFRGVRVLGIRHHSDPYSITWGGHREQYGKARRG